MESKDPMLGRKFGRLTIIEFAGTDNRYHKRYKCICDCGKIVVTLRYSLRNGHTKSCGCYKREKVRARSTRHGHNSRKGMSPTYGSWKSMKRRCLKPNYYIMYKYYGERGITICERWLNFENFLADMGERPKGTSIDRINNDGNYEPGNCRWATPKEQANNRKRRSA